MTGSKKDLINYRLARAWDTLDDANILAKNENGTQGLTDCIMPHITQLWLCY